MYYAHYQDVSASCPRVSGPAIDTYQGNLSVCQRYIPVYHTCFSEIYLLNHSTSARYLKVMKGSCKQYSIQSMSASMPASCLQNAFKMPSNSRVTNKQAQW